MKNYLDYFKKILFLLENSHKKFFLLVVFTLIISLFDILGLSLIAPYISLVLDQSKSISLPLINSFFEFSNSTKKQIIISCGIFILSIYLIKTILSILINKFLLNIAFNEGTKIRASLAKSYLNMPYQDFTLRNTSEYIYSIESLTGQFSNTILPALMKFISDCFIFIIIITFLVFVNWQIIILLFSIFFSVIIFYDLFFRSSLRKAGEKANKHLSLLVKNINESMEGIKELKIFNKENFFLSQIKINSEKFARNAVFAQIIAYSPKYILELLLVFFVVISITITINLNMNVNDLLPTLGVFAFAALRLAPASTQMISNLSVLRATRDTLNRLYYDAIKNDSHNENNNFDQKEKNEILDFKNIKLRNLSFGYKNTKKYIFENANFTISKGDIIGIYGESGVGKTTFIDILLGLLEPTSGNILINDSKDLDTFELRNSVAYLPQKVFLIDDTIQNNIALGIVKDKIDYNLINQSINKSQLQKFITSLPEGINTNIGERGIRLSGGQRQRIALARAFYFNKQILILDESTNSLDKDTEKEILNEVKKISRNITVIIVSHDKSIFNFCNKVYKIENKKITNV